MDLSEMRCVRLPEVISLLGLSRSSIYLQISDGLFPPPIHMSARCSAWPMHEVQRIILARVAQKTESEVREIVREIIKARQSVGTLETESV
ncbi:MAG: AlpA family phage regulatory protein [Burkholderiales bacterium]|nr:AlpA family phage regulatory protein [Burkholderiales bacterium]